MTNSKTMIIILIAFTAGYLTRMFVAPSGAGDDPVDDIILENIELGIAQQAVSNFTGFNKYYVIDDELLEWMYQVKLTYPSAAGTAFYYATDQDSPTTTADMMIAARVLYDGENNPSVTGEYFSTALKQQTVPICPVMCDLQNGLTLEILECPDGCIPGMTESEIEDDIAEDEGL